MKTHIDNWIDTEDVVKGDYIRFERATFTGSWRKPKFAGMETVEGLVVNESYGFKKQQHTFTLSNGVGEKMCIKGRNVYRNGCLRLVWVDEDKRSKVAEEKHERGDKARKERQERKKSNW